MAKTLKLQAFITILILGIILCGATSAYAFFYGKNVTEEKYKVPEVEITSQVILDKITNQYFVVTKTLFLNEEITIKAEQDSAWNELLWGQTISADGIIRLDVGVNMENLKPEDIVIDRPHKIVTIKLPNAEILDSSLFGKINVETDNGILKALFDSDQNGDYNKALTEMITQAETTANADTQIMTEAKDDSTQLISLILGELGYTINYE